MAKLEITQKAQVKWFTLPLPIYETIEIAEAVSENKEKFKIVVGLDKELVKQLEKYSGDESDTNLQKYSKDRQRFVLGSYEDWYKKIRTPFALVHKKTGVMAAMIRFGPEPLFGQVDNWHTIGWRSYGPFRGKGFMKIFTDFTMDVYLQKFPDIKFWITVKKENAGSVKLAEGLGFAADKEKSQRESEIENKETLVMLKLG